ncbi:family 43 glycosylhydrolase [Streptomonospora sp. PA3]|uniref:RICIN domain-containing protein n=1 Tax=Streptomonospora sp. PA3 TaxID=2607326 RepID=UPI0012DF531C|nr:RICIN domain-containing protein [Streptomonospora sp. PA3]MUL41200.1 family 43 glycosylhydrolase [Streptomonospora sp. PA3]
MRRLPIVLVLALISLLAPLAAARPAVAEPVTVANGTRFTDTSGNPLHAHGGGVLEVGDYYYWFGENRGDDSRFSYVSAYRSTDLKNWEFRNHVLTRQSDPELQTSNIERPKVVYNPRTDQYVMWMHKENGRDYSQARAAVAVSDTVDGDYRWLGSFRPLGHMSRDITAFVDDDGTGYMISAARDNYDLHIYRLSPDFTEVEELVANPWPGGHREAPAMFKRDGVYYLVTSGATGWNPNQQKYATADCIECDWSGWSDLGDSTGYGSQTTFVLPVEGSQTTSYLYMGDRWAGADGGIPNDSEYVWLPLEFSGGRTLAMDYYSRISIDTATGRVRGLGGAFGELAARHSGKCLDVVNGSDSPGAELIQYTCHGGGNQQWSIEDTGSGYSRITAMHSGLCLAVKGGSAEPGAVAVQAACDGSAGRQWSVESVGGGYSRIVARHSGLCLDVSDESTENGTRVIQWTCTGGANQQWSHT